MELHEHQIDFSLKLGEIEKSIDGTILLIASIFHPNDQEFVTTALNNMKDQCIKLGEYKYLLELSLKKPDK